jgi:NAD(P)-dependent dehydrogenase (short-subunit alcohol dehydrogenase family)
MRLHSPSTQGGDADEDSGQAARPHGHRGAAATAVRRRPAHLGYAIRPLEPRGAPCHARAAQRSHRADLLGRTSTPGVGPYQTAKWTVEGLSGVLQQEVAPLGIHATLLEPGGLSTDWAGSSMTIHEIREEYQPTVGRMTGLRSAAVMRGDPRKGGQAILRITEVERHRSDCCSAATPTRSLAPPTRPGSTPTSSGRI